MFPKKKFGSALRDRHETGLCAIACDIEACDHYGDTRKGLGTQWWRLRLYMGSFFAKEVHAVIRTVQKWASERARERLL
jgi:hypothetical protein